MLFYSIKQQELLSERNLLLNYILKTQSHLFHNLPQPLKTENVNSAIPQFPLRYTRIPIKTLIVSLMNNDPFDLNEYRLQTSDKLESVEMDNFSFGLKLKPKQKTTDHEFEKENENELNTNLTSTKTITIGGSDSDTENFTDSEIHKSQNDLDNNISNTESDLISNHQKNVPLELKYCQEMGTLSKSLITKIEKRNWVRWPLNLEQINVMSYELCYALCSFEILNGNIKMKEFSTFFKELIFTKTNMNEQQINELFSTVEISTISLFRNLPEKEKNNLIQEMTFNKEKNPKIISSDSKKKDLNSNYILLLLWKMIKKISQDQFSTWGMFSLCLKRRISVFAWIILSYYSPINEEKELKICSVLVECISMIDSQNKFNLKVFQKRLGVIFKIINNLQDIKISKRINSILSFPILTFDKLIKSFPTINEIYKNSFQISLNPVLTLDSILFEFSESLTKLKIYELTNLLKEIENTIDCIQQQKDKENEKIKQQQNEEEQIVEREEEIKEQKDNKDYLEQVIFYGIEILWNIFKDLDSHLFGQFELFGKILKVFLKFSKIIFNDQNKIEIIKLLVLSITKSRYSKMLEIEGIVQLQPSSTNVLSSLVKRISTTLKSDFENIIPQIRKILNVNNDKMDEKEIKKENKKENGDGINHQDIGKNEVGEEKVEIQEKEKEKEKEKENDKKNDKKNENQNENEKEKEKEKEQEKEKEKENENEKKNENLIKVEKKEQKTKDLKIFDLSSFWISNYINLLRPTLFSYFGSIQKLGPGSATLISKLSNFQKWCYDNGCKKIEKTMSLGELVLGPTNTWIIETSERLEKEVDEYILSENFKNIIEEQKYTSIVEIIFNSLTGTLNTVFKLLLHRSYFAILGRMINLIISLTLKYCYFIELSLEYNNDYNYKDNKRRGKESLKQRQKQNKLEQDLKINIKRKLTNTISLSFSSSNKEMNQNFIDNFNQKQKQRQGDKGNRKKKSKNEVNKPWRIKTELPFDKNFEKYSIDELCLRINNFYYINKKLQKIEKLIKTKISNILGITEMEFNKTTKTLLEPFRRLKNQIDDQFLANTIRWMSAKIVFHDLKPYLADTLYIYKPENNRIKDALLKFDPTLEKIVDVLQQDSVIDLILKNLFSDFVLCFEKVLLDGGDSRIFTKDSSFLIKDISIIKNFFMAPDENGNCRGIPRQFANNGFSHVESIISKFFILDTSQLISDFKDLNSKKKTLKINNNPIFSKKNIFKILCHRNEKDAKKFCKKYY
ncbi:protein unc-13 [Anaeramoeba flamelloides]|uniref:Protein unc-13 n=1 Tax=Anaeramoeba flamelloides TaxID=1746091 RepID=A0ABQ8XWW7_9EUKA|nr:protein unc-13 [Anaeramoeba flamelloides]